MVAAGGGIGAGAGKDAGAELHQDESDKAGTTIPMIEKITKDLELKMLDPQFTGGGAFPPRMRVSLVVRGERAPKL